MVGTKLPVAITPGFDGDADCPADESLADQEFTAWMIHRYKVFRCESGDSCHFKEKDCFFSHQKTPERRSLFRTDTGNWSYSAEPCPRAFGRSHEDCPAGILCEKAHSEEEVKYHATQYRTRLCAKGTECAEIDCAYAHSEDSLRFESADDWTPWSVTKERFGRMAPIPGLWIKYQEQIKESKKVDSEKMIRRRSSLLASSMTDDAEIEGAMVSGDDESVKELTKMREMKEEEESSHLKTTEVDHSTMVLDGEYEEKKSDDEKSDEEKKEEDSDSDNDEDPSLKRSGMRMIEVDSDYRWPLGYPFAFSTSDEFSLLSESEKMSRAKMFAISVDTKMISSELMSLMKRRVLIDDIRAPLCILTADGTVKEYDLMNKTWQMDNEHEHDDDGYELAPKKHSFAKKLRKNDLKKAAKIAQHTWSEDVSGGKLSSEGLWTCWQCTFKNSASTMKCTACYANRQRDFKWT